MYVKIIVRIGTEWYDYQACGAPIADGCPPLCARPIRHRGDHRFYTAEGLALDSNAADRRTIRSVGERLPSA